MALRHKTTSAVAAGASAASFLAAYEFASEFAKESGKYIALQHTETALGILYNVEQMAQYAPGSFPTILSSTALEKFTIYVSGSVSAQMQSLQAAMASSGSGALEFALIGTASVLVAVASNYDGIEDGIGRVASSLRNGAEKLIRLRRGTGQQKEMGATVIQWKRV